MAWCLKKLVASLQAAKACKVHRVNKFGQRPTGMTLPSVFVMPAVWSTGGFFMPVARSAACGAALSVPTGT